MEHPKPKRIKNRKLLSSYWEKPCIVCGWPQAEPCHVKGKGAGGPDEAFNLLPMCQNHHRSQHDLGFKRFLEMHPKVRLELEKMGWDTSDMTHPRLK